MGDLPSTIAHFRVVRKIGAGGMGVVFEAVDEKLRRTVALKLLPPEFTKNEERRARFLREARSAAAVTHAHIATIYEVGEDDGRIYIAMELIDGVSLREKLAGAPLGTSEVLRLARQIARALARAHEKGVIHRDLKPDNVMVSSDGDVKLLDFGLAKLREVADDGASPSVLENEETSSHVTQEGRVLGTPGYMSPEQATGKPVDGRSDLFSFGVVVYELLSGVRPFGGGSTMEVIIATSRDDPKPIGELVDDAPEALCALVARCLAKAPADRYADAGALLDALDALNAGVTASRPDLPVARRSDRELAVTNIVSKTPSAITPPTSDPAPTAPAAAAPRSRAVVVVALAICAALALGLAIKFRGTPTPSGGGAPSASASGSSASGSAAAKPAGTTILGLPRPTGCTAEGVRFLDQGLSGFRSGGWHAARRTFTAGLKADPTCAELHLRRVMAEYFTSDASQTRESFRAALELRAKLSPRDQDIVDALEPLMGREPPAMEESSTRLERLVERYSLDAEILIIRSGYTPIDASRRLDLCERAIAIDPDYADARQCAGSSRLELGDVDGARSELAECMRRLPAAVDCALESVLLARRLGECAKEEEAARLWTGRDPVSPAGYRFLAQAIAAQGATREEVAAPLRLQLVREPEERRYTSDSLNAMLAILYGDVPDARASLAKLARSVADDPNVDAHARHDLALAEIFVETGDHAAAEKLAIDFTRRKRGWTRSTINVFAMYAEPRLLAIAGRSGAFTAAQRRADRDAWIAWATPTVREPNVMWSYGHGAFVANEAEAVEAVQTLSPRPKLPSTGAGSAAFAGRSLLLASRPADAIPWLREASARCDALEAPFENTRAHLWLGQALEATGHAKDACAPYTVVVQRWGKTNPLFASAREAAARSKSIGCP